MRFLVFLFALCFFPFIFLYSECFSRQFYAFLYPSFEDYTPTSHRQEIAAKREKNRLLSSSHLWQR